MKTGFGKERLWCQQRKIAIIDEQLVRKTVMFIQILKEEKDEKVRKEKKRVKERIGREKE